MNAAALVTDTHPLVWYFCTDKHKLSKKAQRAFEDAVHKKTRAIYVPTPVLVELSMLIEDGKIRFSTPFERFMEMLFKTQTIIEQPLDRQVVALYSTLNFSSDPFDKMIVATAQLLQMPLITADSMIHRDGPCDLYW